jgi:hypothetical protein
MRGDYRPIFSNKVLVVIPMDSMRCNMRTQEVIHRIVVRTAAFSVWTALPTVFTSLFDATFCHNLKSTAVLPCKS